MQKPLVALADCKNYEPPNLRAALIKLFDTLGGINKYIKRGTKVVLKPNLVMGKDPAKCATTNPEFFKQLAILLKEHGAEVHVAESPGGPYTTARLNAVYNTCGIEAAAKETGITLNRTTETVKLNNPQGKYLKTIELIKPLAEADFIINLPKPKSHGQMTYTGAVKNMFGAVAGVFKADYHLRMSDYSIFANTIIDIFLSVKPKLNIMDAVFGMEGNGPTSGTPKHIGLLCAAEDAFALDVTMLEILNLEPSKVPVLREAQIRNLAPENTSGIEIRGANPKDYFIEKFDFPALRHAEGINWMQNNLLIKPFASYFKPYPKFIFSKCISCGECMRACPAKVITMPNKKPIAELKNCVRCFCCQELCPANAVEIKRSIVQKVVQKIYSKIMALYNFIAPKKSI